MPRYDYSQNGYYFLTICTAKHIDWLGKIENRIMVLNEYGNIVSGSWNDLPHHYSNIKPDEFVVMPNHVHGIIVIDNKVGNGFKPFPTQHGLSEIIRGFKTFSSRKINETICSKAKFHWQKSFYDHVIRNEASLDRVREYITINPARWDADIENRNAGNGFKPFPAPGDYYSQIFN